MPCKVCNKPTQYELTNKGFKEYCSHSCMQKWRWNNGKRDRNKSPFGNPEVQAKIRETNLERYGAEYHMQNPEHAKKWKAEYKEKTGCDCPLNNPNLRNILSESEIETIIQFRKDNPKLADSKIASMFPGHSRNTISKLLKDAGFEPGGRISEKTKQEIVEYRRTHDKTNDEIATQFKNCSRSTIGRIIKNAELVPGGAHANFTKEKIISIIKFKTDHPTLNDSKIAIRVGVSQTALSRILREAGIDSPWQISEEEKASFIEYRKQNNVSDSEIARVFKRSPGAVGHVLRDAGIGPGSTSKPEMFIYRFIQSRFPQFELKQHDRTLISPLEIDIYIPEIKTGIEMNGLYWHANRERYHYDKFKKAQATGVSLLQIWDTECDLHHMRILQSMLRCRAGVAQRIPARKCKIIEMDPSMARAFYEYNHWNGFLPSERHFGLTYKTRLVAALSVSKSRYRKGYTEITRCCSRLNCVVMGGVDRLIQHIEKEYDSPLVSYSDNRLFSGESFKKNGFDLERDDSIGYFWFKQDGNLLKRYQTQKHKLSRLLGDGFDPSETEVQNMEANGWVKVYDAGQSTWTKEIPSNFGQLK